MKMLTPNSGLSAKATKVAALTFTTVTVLTACVAEPKYPSNHYYSPTTGTFPTAQTVSLSIPSDATNLFISTDTVDPWPSVNCVKKAGDMDFTFDRSTALKIRYELYGKQVTDARYYFIEDAPAEKPYRNRNLLDTWENFFASHVIPRFTIPDQDHSLLTAHDGQGGTVTLETNITERGWIWDDPEEGNQTYRFDNYHYTDPKTGESFVIESGAVYGFRGESRGFYNTETHGETIVFSGDINGWAEGSFKMDGEGNTTSGYYRIFCSDDGCANQEAIYGLNSATNGYIQVSDKITEDTVSCSPRS